jgi:hypothetical protein
MGGARDHGCGIRGHCHRPVVRKAAREQRQIQASQWIAAEWLIADLRKRSEVSDQQGRGEMKTGVAGME